MIEKELLSQLNNLKNIKPGKEWKEQSREVLISQISAGDYSFELGKQTIKVNILYYLRNFIHQPVLVVATILLIVLGGGVLSINASKNTKPGDSFYIAKIISERAQLAITFNEEEKAKLGIEFAGNRAKEITQVLAEYDNGDKEERVERLAENFQKEINSARNRLKNISKDEESGSDEEDLQIFSANLGKEDRGMQIYVQEENNDSVEPGIEDTELQEDIIITAPETQIGASSTVSVSNDVEKTLEEAEKLFAEEDYDGTLNKLEEVINQINEEDGPPAQTGEIKGESESALPAEGQDEDLSTTTGEVLGISGEEADNTISTEDSN
jgi:hypothetical protein